MSTVIPSAIGRSIAKSFGDGFAAPLVMLAVLGLLILRGIWILPDGYDGSGGLNAMLLLLLTVWCMGMMWRATRPGSRIASGFVALSLYMGVSFFASMAAASSAVGSGDYIDPWLAQIDQHLFPFYDWKAVALGLPEYPQLYRLLNLCYSSFGWQPLVFVVFAVLAGKVTDLSAFVTAWGLGLVLCVLPFHWLPAVSPFPYYGILQSDMPDHLTALPWDFLPVMEGLRDGSIRALNASTVTGMITMPSFHAGGAVILAWAFWRFRWARWLFVPLNIMVALSAVPIGSHYVIDVVAGSLVGTVAVVSTTFIFRTTAAMSLQEPANNGWFDRPRPVRSGLRHAFQR